MQAAEGLFSSVHAVVFLQTGCLTEAFPTQCAVVWLLARVDTLVQDQGAGVGEVFPTIFTHHEPVRFKRPGVGLGDHLVISVWEVTFGKRGVADGAGLCAVRTHGISVHEIIINRCSCAHVRSGVRDVVGGGVEYAAFPRRIGNSHIAVGFYTRGTFIGTTS